MNSSGTGANARWWPAMLLAVAASFAALSAVIATSDAVPAVDLTVARWVQGVDFPAWTGLLRLAAYLTDKPAGPAIVVAFLFALWLRRLPAEMIVLSVAQTLYVPQLWVKQLVQRPRPTEDLISITEMGDGFAFPSGHITLGVAVYGTVAMIALTRLKPGWRRKRRPGSVRRYPHPLGYLPSDLRRALAVGRAGRCPAGSPLALRDHLALPEHAAPRRAAEAAAPPARAGPVSAPGDDPAASRAAPAPGLSAPPADDRYATSRDRHASKSETRGPMRSTAPP